MKTAVKVFAVLASLLFDVVSAESACFVAQGLVASIPRSKFLQTRCSTPARREEPFRAVKLFRAPHLSIGSVRRFSRVGMSLRQHNAEETWRDLEVPVPGCVLVASPDEVDHFFRRAVVLILSTGGQGNRRRRPPNYLRPGSHRPGNALPDSHCLELEGCHLFSQERSLQVVASEDAVRCPLAM